MPTIVISSAAPHDIAATEMEKQQQKKPVLNTSDREQKSLTTGNISPKQKILHNIL